jgi:lipopolysaccharide export system permease protein
MKTLRRLLYRDIAGSVLFIALAFLALFFFIDVVEELSAAARRGGTPATATLLALLEAPGNLYELAPISMLIGTIYALSRMAQASEFTILRTAGLGPGKALGLLLLPGAVFGALTFGWGEWVVPQAERASAELSARLRGAVVGSGQGAWLKDSAGSAPGARSSAVHVRWSSLDGQLQGVRIFEFDGDSRLIRRIEADSATVGRDGLWQLVQARLTDWPVDPGQGASGAAPLSVRQSPPGPMTWRSSLTPDVVNSAVRPLATMSTPELWRYSRHLASQEQAAQRYEIRFWKRVLYPLSCLVMAALALPFAYLHARSGGISLKVFGGIMLGISFVLVNHLAGHLGLLREWTPWVAAAVPSFAYLMLSLAAFAWLVRFR